MSDDPFEPIEEALVGGKPVPVRLLSALSILDGESLNRFHQIWRKADGAARGKLIARLRQEAESNMAMDFAAVYRLGLDDPDPAVRELAYPLVAEAADERLLDLFLRAAQSDPDPDARVAAIDGLGSFTLAAELDAWPAATKARLEQALREILHSPESKQPARRSALLSLSYLTTPQVEVEIRQAHLQPDLRGAAVIAMGRNCQAMWLPDVTDELAAEDPALRQAAIAAAAELEDERLVPSLLPLINDEDSDIQLAVVEALGVIGGRHAKGALTELLMAKDRELRMAARDALEELTLMEDPFRALSEGPTG